MKLRKLSTILGVVSLLAVQVVPVGAATKTLTNTSDTSSADMNVSFDASMSDLGGVIITIPETLTLSYNSENGDYINSSHVSARGIVEYGKKLSISTEDKTIFKHSKGKQVTVDGDVSFGTQYWTADQLSINDVRDITIKTSKSKLKYAGQYNSIVTFNISFADE